MKSNGNNLASAGSNPYSPLKENETIEGGVYIGELSLGYILKEDMIRFQKDLMKIGYLVVEAKDAEPDTYDIHRIS